MLVISGAQTRGRGVLIARDALVPERDDGPLAEATCRSRAGGGSSRSRVIVRHAVVAVTREIPMCRLHRIAFGIALVLLVMPLFNRTITFPFSAISSCGGDVASVRRTSQYDTQPLNSSRLSFSRLFLPGTVSPFSFSSMDF